MRYRNLGRTGVEVSTQCLGTMMFGDMGNKDHDDCIRIIHAALDAGINFIDTADIYSQGESEQIVGKAIKGRREDLVIATKFFNPIGPERNHRGGSRRWIMAEVEHSLRRLETDYLDLYQIHRWDWSTDIDETLGALSDLVHQGKVRYLGSSVFAPEQIVEAQWVAERRGRERFVCEQPQYSIFARSIEESVLPTCQRYGMGAICWSPLAGGWLAGKYRRGNEPAAGSRYAEGSLWTRHYGSGIDIEADPRFDLFEGLEAVATEAGLTITQLGLGFTDADPGISSTIIGPRTMDQLEGNLAAADVVLDAATIDAIDAICPPGLDAPGIVHHVPNPSLADPALRRR
jgi:aryl-alcohol dehydrogenase (NADP+)